MTNQYKERIAERIVQVCDVDKMMSRSELARKAQVNVAFMTHIVARKWDNYSNNASIKPAIFRAIAQQLGLDIDVFETNNYLAVIDACSSAKLNHEYRVISGEVGSGKTFALNDFARQYPKSTYLVRCSALMTVKEFLRQIARACNVDVEASKVGLVDAIISKLRMEESPLLLIDEAENLKDIGYAAIKDLYDGLEGKAGILLVGANRYYDYLADRARRGTSGTQRTYFPQLFSRFRTEPIHLSRMTRDEVQTIVEAYGLGGKTEVRQLHDGCNNFRELFAKVRRQLSERDLLEQANQVQSTTQTLA
jgi:DNA transposition AAA+ family ATPase